MANPKLSVPSFNDKQTPHALAFLKKNEKTVEFLRAFPGLSTSALQH
jgi:hypothetical protein